MRVLETCDGAHELLLHIEGQARRNPIRIHLLRVEPLGFDKDLMRALIGEAHDLVLDRRAVARTDPLDDSGEHGGAIAGRPNYVVRTLVCLRYETVYLSWVLTGSPDERKHRRRLIARLRVITEKSMLRPSSLGGVPVFSRPTRSGSSRRRAARRSEAGSPATASRVLIKPHVDTATEESAHGQHHRTCREGDTGDRDHTGDAAALDGEIRHLLLKERKVRLALEHQRMARRYSCRSACARVARTAGPLLAFSVRNWMPARSAARAMAPPSASISRTR
jgi:hypothetical protein